MEALLKSQEELSSKYRDEAKTLAGRSEALVMELRAEAERLNIRNAEVTAQLAQAVSQNGKLEREEREAGQRAALLTKQLKEVQAVRAQQGALIAQLKGAQGSWDAERKVLLRTVRGETATAAAASAGAAVAKLRAAAAADGGARAPATSAAMAAAAEVEEGSRGRAAPRCQRRPRERASARARPPDRWRHEDGARAGVCVCWYEQGEPSAHNRGGRVSEWCMGCKTRSHRGRAVRGACVPTSARLGPQASGAGRAVPTAEQLLPDR